MNGIETLSKGSQLEQGKAVVFMDCMRRIKTAKENRREFVQLYGMELIGVGHLIEQQGYQIDRKLNRIYVEQKTATAATT